jgi:hypothetical protein
MELYGDLCTMVDVRINGKWLLNCISRPKEQIYMEKDTLQIHPYTKRIEERLYMWARFRPAQVIHELAVATTPYCAIPYFAYLPLIFHG